MAEYDREIVNLAQQILGQRSSQRDLPLTESEAQLPIPTKACPEHADVPEGDLAEQKFGQGPSKPNRAPPEPAALRQILDAWVEEPPDHAEASKGKQTKPAAELAAMIEAALARHPQCPRQGFQVTVYGTTLWRAMLMITPAAGAVRNPQEWRDLTDEFAERLRKRYDLDWR